MNDDILLTPEEWNAAAERGITKWTDQLDPNNPTSFSSSAPFVYEEVCRAQLRKVAEWMKEHTTQRLVVNADFSNEEFIRVSMTGSDWQALRTALEGK